MSVTATNYISCSDLEIWMEQKTENLYGNLRTSMDTSNDRADAEEALNKIKADLVNASKSGDEPSAIRDEIQAAVDKYKDEFPAVADTLQPVLDKLNQDITYAHTPLPLTASGTHGSTVTPPNAPDRYPPPAKVSTDDSDRFGKQISDCVDGLGKEDQLAMINIQEFNSQINQTKQIASALMDSMDKSANAIISHIS